MERGGRRVRSSGRDARPRGRDEPRREKPLNLKGVAPLTPLYGHTTIDRKSAVMTFTSGVGTLHPGPERGCKAEEILRRARAAAAAAAAVGGTVRVRRRAPGFDDGPSPSAVIFTCLARTVSDTENNICRSSSQFNVLDGLDGRPS